MGSRSDVPHTGPRGATVRDAFPSFPPNKSGWHKGGRERNMGGTACHCANSMRERVPLAPRSCQLLMLMSPRRRRNESNRPWVVHPPTGQVPATASLLLPPIDPLSPNSSVPLDGFERWVTLSNYTCPPISLTGPVLPSLHTDIYYKPPTARYWTTPFTSITPVHL